MTLLQDPKRFWFAKVLALDWSLVDINNISTSDGLKNQSVTILKHWFKLFLYRCFIGKL